MSSTPRVPRSDDVFMQSGFAQAVVSADGLIVAVNDEMCAMFGRKAEELLDEPILCAEQARPEDEPRLRRVLSGDVPLARFERRVPSRYGGSVDLLISLTGVRVDGRVDAAAVCVQDVTDLKSAQRRAESEEARWRSLSQNASEVALVTDATLTITYVSPAMTRLLGHDPQDVCGTSMLSLVHPEDVPRVTAAMRRLVAKKTRKSEIGYRVTNSSGHWRHVEQYVLNLLEDAHVEGLVVNLRDMTELEELRTARRRAVLEDRLTGLPNRALLMDRVEQAIERRHRTGGQYALLHIDLDKFRAINDTYGQGAGDIVLRRVSDTLCTLVGPSDTVGRYAGDEFVVLIDDASDPSVVDRVASRVRQGLVLEVDVDATTTVNVSACVGVAHGPASSAEALIAAAEAATAYAKDLGRGRMYVLEDGLRHKVDGQRRLATELAAVVAEDGLALHYQPIVELRTGDIVGFEALVRWQHATLGLLGPDLFLPLADGLDLQDRVDDWVLTEACRTARGWSGQAPAPFVAVNVSPQRLVAPGYGEKVERALKETGLAAERLVLEVTETAVVSDLSAAQAVLEALRALGVRISIDDFGTGYSSMLQLRQLPFTSLKIDREFVAQLPHGDDDRAICASVVSLANKLGVRTVAEGVERWDQATQLAWLGCQFGQGFLWSPAVDGASAQRLLDETPWGAVPFVRSSTKIGNLGDEDPAVVARARELHESGASLHTIAAGLNRSGMRTRAGRRWHPSTIARLLWPLPIDQNG